MRLGQLKDHFLWKIKRNEDQDLTTKYFMGLNEDVLNLIVTWLELESPHSLKQLARVRSTAKTSWIRFFIDQLN